ncbi:NUDIX hydrolase [Nannocystis bainbridge]|uniref:NUDIX hydrolase n=1 Tax=Nannocystis bainbridge TaxID=2995303 RepID=A0ABT5E2C0_9BACT|nr:NUDIX hydrolase [Nannocystis bainbridge]MDC0720010.1 NUDIX hydrolase [Nannocystis bainbridge]
MTLTDPGRLAGVRLAATVVLLRERAAGDPQVFMLRRSARSPFMPDTLVFPGGAVDPDDGPEGSDEAFDAAARRECREEAGVALEARDLHWFDTWLTPAAEPRRYFARFYLARLTEGEFEDAAADGHETHEGRWATPAELLAAWQREEVDLPPPTLCTLMRLADERRAGLVGLPAALVHEPILPKGLLQPDADGEARLVVVLPHDPAYPELPGDGVPAPARVADLPHRLVRAGRTWRLC